MVPVVLRGGKQFFLFLVIIWVENFQGANLQPLPSAVQLQSLSPPDVCTALQQSLAAGRAEVRIPREAGCFPEKYKWQLVFYSLSIHKV